MLYLLSNVELEKICFIKSVSQHETVARYFKSGNINFIGVLKRSNYRDYWVLTNASWVYLGFALDLSDIHLLDKKLSDTDLDLFETFRFLTSKYFFSLQDVLNDSWRYVLKTFWRRFEDVFSLTNFCFPRRFKDILKTTWRRSWKTRNYYTKHIFKTSARHILKMFFRPFVDQQILMRFIFYMIKRNFLTFKLPDYSQPRPKNIRG